LERQTFQGIGRELIFYFYYEYLIRIRLTFMDKDSTISLHTGSEMPVMGLGTWELTQDIAGAVALALALGYRLMDTSSDYGTQPGIGEGRKESNIDRKSLYIVTKVEEMDDAYERTKSNMQELGLDYVDLMLLHRPPPTGAGEELWEGLISAKKEGADTRYWSK
jgi:2,5-diketo-D-gluconate reductase A